jgi:threonine dehydrogenase-like Zn-dependent dehydrogenase
VGLCATDLALYSGTYKAPHRLPLCFGHEWSGIVEDVGHTVQDLKPGDRVVGECSLWCGKCDLCSRNKNLCRHIEKFGITTDGAARTQVVVEERFLHRGKPAMDMGVLALAEPLAVAAKGIAAAADNDPEFVSRRILVLGGGMIGIACVAVLRLVYRCQAVALLDPVSARAARAQWFGAVPLVAPNQPYDQAVRGYGELYGRDGYDVVFETTGSEAAFTQALLQLNPAGTVVHFGFLEGASLALKLLVLKGASMIGSIGGSGMFDMIVAMLVEHADVLRNLVTHAFWAGDFPAAFAAAGDRESALKTQIRFSPAS